MTTKVERLQAAIQGERADRAPVALWRHFPVDDQDPVRLADSIAGFQKQHDFDFVKVTPASSYCVRDWGVEDIWEGATEGTRRYTQRVIHNPEDWSSLKVLDPQAGALADQLRCLEVLRQRVGAEVPVIQTVFNPLSQAKNLAGEARLFEHIRRSPEAVEAGLERILQSTLGFIEALQESPIDGIFFAVQHASYHYFDRAGYEHFGEHFDLPILERAENWWLNVLHLHGAAVHFELAARYPVQVVNWHDLETAPSLKEGSQMFKGAVCGGTRRRTISLGSAEEVQGEAESALATMQSGGFILSTGCVVPIIAPPGNLRVIRNAVEFA
jgi:uroporphyrinogen decarboxylase